jgi:hypothetical protein
MEVGKEVPSAWASVRTRGARKASPLINDSEMDSAIAAAQENS